MLRYIQVTYRFGEGGVAVEVRLLDLSPSYAMLPFVAPLKIGSGVIRSAACLTVTARVQTRDGREGTGRGAILLSHVWAWPGPGEPAEKELAMQRSAEEHLGRLLADGGYRTPLQWYTSVPPPTGVPPLAAAVAASPADAAIHDALGKAVGACSYDLLPAHITRHLQPRAPHVSVMHTVGLLDPLESLSAPILTEGIRGFKIKLGGDPAADAARTTDVFRYATALSGPVVLSVDGNESYAGANAVTEYLHRLPADVLDAVAFVEQPVPRHSRESMAGPASLKPVLADEGWSRPEELDVLLDLGWSGAVLKTCKGHSASLLAMARLVEKGCPYAIQDLTNPGIALLHSLGLAARCSPLGGLEANARQYLPAHHPPGFPVQDGKLTASNLGPVGLGY